MMKRKLFISMILLLALSSGATGRTIPLGSFFDRFVIGAEWGYTQCVFRSRNYNFISEEGYRVYDRSHGSSRTAPSTPMPTPRCSAPSATASVIS